jgi:hypothetical protein
MNNCVVLRRGNMQTNTVSKDAIIDDAITHGITDINPGKIIL